MSDPLADIIEGGSQAKALKALENLTSYDPNVIIQLSKLTGEELEYYSMLIDIGQSYNMSWMVELAYREIAMKKSVDGWLVTVIAGILEKFGRVIADISGGIGEVSQSVKEAFSK